MSKKVTSSAWVHIRQFLIVGLAAVALTCVVSAAALQGYLSVDNISRVALFPAASVASVVLEARVEPSTAAMSVRDLFGTHSGTFTVINTNDDGPGSLRDAINQSNASADDETIDFLIPGCAAATPCAINLTTGELTIANNGSLTITGPGAPVLTVSGGNQSRIFNVALNANVFVSDLTLTAGKAPDAVTGTPAANGGAIYNAGNLTISNTTVSSSVAGNGRSGGGSTESNGGAGGAVFSSGALALSGVTLTNNRAGTGGNGLDCFGSCGSTFTSGDGGDGGGIYNAGTLTVSSLTANGNQAGNGGGGANTFVGDIGGPGGKGGRGGVIYNSGASFQITGSTITNNFAGTGGQGGVGPLSSGSPIGTYGGFGGDGGPGGAIYNAAGTAFATGNIISGNHAGNAGNAGRGVGGGFTGNSGFGGIGGSGGGIFNTGTLTLSNSTVSTNTAGTGGKNGEAQNPSLGVAGGDGGGIYTSGNLTLTGSTVSGNIAGGGGQGSFANNGGRGGDGGRGGGIYTKTSPVAMSNTTVSGNIAGAGGRGGNCFGQGCGHSQGGPGGDGGGVYNGFSMDLTNATISNNTTGAGGQGGNDTNLNPGVFAPNGSGGGVRSASSATNLRNSIVAKNLAAGSVNKDVFGAFTSRSHNFIGQKDGSTGLTDGVNNDQVGTNGSPKDPLLGPLQNNGGPTPSHNLPPNSPAVGTGDNCVLTANGCLDNNPAVATDQRGLIRPQGAIVDIGAVEALTSIPNTPDLLSSADNGTSNTDNLTNAATLEFQVTGAIPSSSLELLRGATVVSTTTADAGGIANFSYADAAADGVYSFSARYAISGAAGTASSGLSVTIDRTAPNVAINQAGGQADPVNTLPVNFAVSFSEPVTGFSAPGVLLTGTAGNIGGATINITGTAAAYNVAVTNLSATGTVQAAVIAAAATDAAGNANLVSTSADDIVTYDITAPTVSIVQAAGQTDPTSSLPIVFTVTFSEPVTGFTNSDVLLTGSTANVSAAAIGVTGSGALYNVTIGNVTASGTVVATVAANAAVDAAGNLSTVSAGGDNTVTYDLPAPLVTIDQASGQIDPTSGQPINFTIVFSEPVTGFTNSDVSLAGSTANTAGANIVVTGSGTTYNAAVAGVSTSGTVRASIPAGGAINVDGDGNAASTSTDNIVTFDITAPTVTVDQAPGQPDPANAEPVLFSVVFSEPVTGFAAGDVSLTGSTADVSGAAVNITGTGAAYSIAVTNIRSSGTVLASVVPGAATDGVGNTSLASTSTDNVVTFSVGTTDLIVNQLGDAGDGVCDATCTLRDAITASNASTGVKNITFSLPTCLPASPCTITLTGGELAVSNSGAVNINGPGSTALSVSGNSTSRVFNLAAGSLAAIADISITGGRAAAGGNGGGILNGGNLSLSNVSINGNAAGNGADGPFASGAAGSVGGHGGGIFNNGGALTLTNCALTGNSAGTAGNGSNGFGTGSIGNGGSGGSGGGIFNNGGTLNVRNSTLSGNNAGTGGNPGAQNGNGLRIGNGGDGGHGGGFYSTGGAVVISNSTFSGNNAGSGQTGLGFQGQHGGNGGGGGAIYLGSGTVLMINATVSLNHGGNAGLGDFGASSGAGGSGGGILLAAGSAKLRNDIVSGNTAPQNGPDLSGTFTTLGHNFIGKSDGSTGFVDGTAGDKVGTAALPKDALLSPLQYSGGPTQTHNPASNSPVKDAGDNCVLNQSCPGDNPGFNLGVDQRGAPRPQGPVVDTGSVEVIAGANAPDLVNVSDSGISQTDNLTSATSLSFRVDGATTGVTVQLLSNGTVVATSTADGGGVVNFSFNDSSADGTYNFTSQQVIAGAASPQSAPLAVTIDRTGPGVTVEQAAGQVDPASAQPVNFTATFDGPVIGFTNTDISLAGSTADVSAATIVVTGTGPSYNIAVGNILQAGTVIASVPAVRVIDDAGNSNTTSTSVDNTITVSIPRPSVTIDQAAAQADPTNVLPINFTVVFSVPVTGLSSSGVSLAGSTAGVGSATINVTGSGTTYNVAIGGITSGNLVVTVLANAANGLGGGNVASTSTDNTVTYDTSPPAVTIDQASGQADPTSVQPINFTAVFNRVVTGFGPGGISLAGSTADVSAATITVTGTGPAYNVAVGNIQSSGIVRATVLAGAATGLGGATAASTSTDNEVNLTGNSLVVNLTSDDGDETCDATCTLRDAVNNANASPGFDDITFNLPSCTGAPVCTITLTKGPFFPFGNGDPLTITTGSNISIHGPGKTVLAIDGNSAQQFNSTRVFTVQAGARLSVTDLTITNGTASDFESDTNYRGGGIYNGGGDVWVSNVLFTGNRARIGFQGGFNGNTPGTAGSEGGAIFNASGTINVSNCTFTANSGGKGGQGGGSSADTGTGPGGAGGPGGAIYNAATMTVTASTFNNNTAGAGGAPGSRNNNNALPRGTGGNGGNGGAIYNTGTLFLVNSTLSGNSSGAGTNGGQNGSGGNSGSGGGLVNAGGTTLIVNSTIANGAVAPAGIKGTLGVQNGTVGSGGGVLVTGGVVSVRNTIVAKNTVPAGGVAPDLFGAFATGGHNFIGKSDGSTGFADGVNADQVGSIAAPKDPLLGALLTNGGPTQTLALAAASTAKDAGDNCVLNQTCPANNLSFNLTTDQRGVGRPQFVAVDIGAYEFAPPLSVTIDQAAGQADPAASLPISYTVVFARAVTGLTSADVSLAGSTANVASASINVTGSGTTYTVTVGNISDGLVKATIPVGAAADSAGVLSDASTSTDNTVTFDAPPTVTINQAAAQADPTNTQPVNFTVVFNETVTGFAPGDVSLTGSTANVSAATVTVTGTGPTYNVAVANVTSDGTLQVSIPANGVTDTGGHGNFASTSTDNQVNLDITRPGVTINQAAAQADPTAAQPVSFSVLFTEPVTGFDGNDVSLAGSTANVSAASRTVTGSGTSYTVTINGLLSSGTVQASIGAGAASDITGNTNTSSTSTDNIVTFTAAATNLVVNQTGDAGDGVCDATCTLRDAITTANNTAGLKSITFNLPACTVGSPCVITLTGGELAVANNGGVNLTGPGANILSVSGNNLGRVINVAQDAVLAITGLRLTGGQTAAGQNGGTANNGFGDGLPGGNGQDGGAILSSGSLSLTNCVITGNTTGNGGTGGNGGADGNPRSGGAGGAGGRGAGIYSNGGTLSLTGTTVSANTTGNGGKGGTAPGIGGASSGTGGAGGHGGGIYSTGPLSLTNSSVTGNITGSAGDGADANGNAGTGLGGNGGSGAGIFSGGTLNMTGTTVSGNNTGGGGHGGNDSGHLDGARGGDGGSGAGVYSLGAATLANSTITNNNAGAGNFGGYAITFTSCPCGNNAAGGDGGSGGGVFNAGTLTLVNTTISNNTAGARGEGVPNPFGGNGPTGNPGSGGGIAIGTGAVSVRNTIVSANTLQAGGTGPDAIGTFTSLGHNVIANSGGTAGFGVIGDLVNVDPLLGALQNNGGPTQTRAIGTTSPAKNAGDNCVLSASCPGLNLSFGLVTDQRGVGRPQGSTVDIGAYEFDLAAASIGLTSSANPSLTGQPVTFTATVTGPGTPTGTVTFLDNGVAIAGCTGVTVTAIGSTCFAPSLALGSHPITVGYSGDANFNPATVSLTGGPQVVTNTATWTGAANTDWNNVANWGSNVVPLATHDVVLPAAGVTNQPAIPSGNLVANSLTVANGRTLNVSGGNLTVNGILSMGGGDITVASGSLLTIGGGGSVARTSGSVIGNIKKDFAAPGTFIYPVGTVSGYSPVDTIVTAGTGSLTIRANTGTAPANPALNPAIVIQRYWTLSGSGITADITWHYLQTDVPGTANESLFSIMRIVGGGPVEAFLPNGSTRLIDTAGNTFTMKGMSVFSDWLVGIPSAPTAAHVNVSGRVLDASGRGLSQALVSMADSGGNTVYAVTNPFGYYHFRDVTAGRTYVFGVINKRYTYAPRVITVNDELAGLDLVPER